MTRLVAVISLLTFSFNANAEWGQQWGSMVWGQSSTNVPMMGGLSQFVFFGLLLVIGVFVTKRWGLIKTLPAIALLSLMPLMVDADEIELNSFQNGNVADANQVNENFNNLKDAIDNIKTIMDMNTCYSHEGTVINGECFGAEIEVDGRLIFREALQDLAIRTFDTSAYIYKNSNFIRLEGNGNANYSNGEPLPFNINCNLHDPSGVIVANISMNLSKDYDQADNIPIQSRGVFELRCSSDGLAYGGEIWLQFHENTF